MRTNLIEIQNLKVSFVNSGSPAVDNVSFSIEQGQTVGIVGESGSGKTLSALSLINLLPETADCQGKILYNEKNGNVIDLNGKEKSLQYVFRGKRIAMIFQEPMSSLNPALRCGSQVAEILLEHTEMDPAGARKEVLRLFEEVDLPRPDELYRSYPHQLSGGQRQRVMIAMAIACKPDLLIADEPTTALDVTVQKTILDLLKSLRTKYRISILFISHDLGVIADIADKVLVMYKGKIVEQGSTKEIISNPQHPYTQGLLACLPPLTGRPHRLPTLDSYLPDRDSEKKTESIIAEERTRDQKSPSNLLRVSGITSSFASKRNLFGKPVRKIHAVHNVSFDLYEGETLGLVGESGCGKTSLGRSILQLIRSGRGEIIYRGVKVHELKANDLRRFRKKAQIIFQDPYSSLNPGLTAGEAIIEPMKVHGLYSSNKQRKEKVFELLNRVSLEPVHFYRYPHQFSGGQRQRIGIARALAVEPEMIICDESVSALDVSVQAQILNLLNELKEDLGLTYLFISHDLAVVRYMSDRIMVMKKGEIVESGNSDRVFNDPEEDYTRKLMDAIPKF